MYVSEMICITIECDMFLRLVMVHKHSKQYQVSVAPNIMRGYGVWSIARYIQPFIANATVPFRRGRDFDHRYPQLGTQAVGLWRIL